MSTRLQALQYNAIEAINAIVECKGVTFDDRNAAIKLVAQHLLARAAQTAPRPDDPQPEGGDDHVQTGDDTPQEVDVP